MRLLIFAFTLMFFVACNNTANKDTEPAQSKSDSLLTLVLQGHDVAMPQMYKMERLQKETKSKADSLQKLPTASVKEIGVLNEAFVKLHNADAAMHSWMNEFKYDSLKDNEPQRELYLKAQLESVTAMKDSVLASINYADSILKTTK